jgi:hypothetical protein
VAKAFTSVGAASAPSPSFASEGDGAGAVSRTPSVPLLARGGGVAALSRAPSRISKKRVCIRAAFYSRSFLRAEVTCAW